MHKNGFIGVHGGFLGWGMAWHHAPGLPLAPCGAVGRLFPKSAPSCILVHATSELGLAMWVSIASDAACAAALQQAVVDFGVIDTDTLQAVLQIPETAAGLARALCTALQAAPPAAEIMTDEQADEAQVNVGTPTSAANDMVDISVAEAMISEALCMVDEAQHRERLAGVRARSWEDRAET
jgi:hypothetical protein